MNLKFFTIALLATGATAGRKGFEVEKNVAKKIADLHRFVDLHHGQDYRQNAAKKIADRLAAKLAANLAASRSAIFWAAFCL